MWKDVKQSIISIQFDGLFYPKIKNYLKRQVSHFRRIGNYVCTIMGQIFCALIQIVSFFIFVSIILEKEMIVN